MSVHVVTCTDDLNQEEASLDFGESFTTTQHIHKRATRAQFEYHINVVIAFETLLEADNVWMAERFMNPNLSIELQRRVNPTDLNDDGQKYLGLRLLCCQ